MGQGLELYNGNSQLKFATSDFTFRYLGEIYLPYSANSSGGNTPGGSLVVPGFSTGTPKVIFQEEMPPELGNFWAFFTAASINIVISGNTLSWSWSAAPLGSSGKDIAGTIVYGVT